MILSIMTAMLTTEKEKSVMMVIQRPASAMSSMVVLDIMLPVFLIMMSSSVELTVKMLHLSINYASLFQSFL